MPHTQLNLSSNMTDAPRWLSGHIFFETENDIYSAECDHVIQSVVAPFVAHCRAMAWIDRYFFIRYTEDGSHVRLRLFGAPDRLASVVAPALEQWVVEKSIPSKPLTLRWITYEPEYNRYGGVAGTAVSERQFCHASDVTLTLLDKLIDKGQSARFGQALLLMTTLLHVFTESQPMARDLAQAYTRGYLHMRIPDEHRPAWQQMFERGFDRQAEQLALYFHEAWQRLEAGDALTPLLDQYRDQMREIRDELCALEKIGRLHQHDTTPYKNWHSAIFAIVPSYIHMLNNRLGIPILEEAYLAHLIARAIERTTAELS